MSSVKCPLCKEGDMEYISGKAHIWICDECPAVLFEYCEYKDADNIAAELKAREKPQTVNNSKKKLTINFGSSFSM